MTTPGWTDFVCKKCVRKVSRPEWSLNRSDLCYNCRHGYGPIKSERPAPTAQQERAAADAFSGKVMGSSGDDEVTVVGVIEAIAEVASSSDSSSSSSSSSDSGGGSDFSGGGGDGGGGGASGEW